MRCNFCGWDNPQGKETCEKCNKPLTGSTSDKGQSVVPNQDRPTDRQVAGEFNPKATVRETTAECHQLQEESPIYLCPQCGYTLEDGKCSSCGYNASEPAKKEHSKVAEDAKKTIRPIRKTEKEGAFMLIPISEETGMPEGDELSFEGNNVILNRDNTDSKNKTITSQEQAVMTFENGKWCIEDKSEFKTTFVQASRKIELSSGDLILLGNQLYRFDL